MALIPVLFNILLTSVLLVPLLSATSYAASESKPSPGGRVVLTGSVPLANLISMWGYDFTVRNPRISFTTSDAGSAVGV